ncbi:MAG: hypothetical protein IJV25_01220 [Prevotella sp.]|nr:hypothetical protein [Prevotella sp.]
MDNITIYKQLNESYHKKFIHHFGTGQGFFSELNSLLFSTLYCLKNNLRLELYSNDATFCFGNGWSEFFEVFCPQYNNNFIGKRISRGYYNDSNGDKYLFLYKILTKNLISSDVYWYCRTSWFEHSRFIIPELNIDGDIRQAMKTIIPIVYRFNTKYTTIINKMINDLNIPSNYISLHVRAGDKKTERDLIEPQDYLDRAKKISSCRNCFVATDDYSIYEKIRDNNPDYSFFTTTSPEERGYDQNKFSISSKEIIQNNLIELFASIQIILNSELFVGTYSSNPGMFIGMLLGNKMIGMDFERWLII